MATEKETIILDFQIEQGDAISELEKTKKSIIQLKQEQKELNDAYKKGNVTIDEYAQEQVRLEGILKKQQNTYNNVQKSVTGVKTQFDKLIDSNKGIQKSMEGTSSSLAALVPGFSGAASGVTSVTTASKAFIATPIGAVIGALGLALAALTSYFKGSEKGQNDLNKIMNVGSAIVGKFSDALQWLGEKVFGTLISGGEKIIGFLNKFIPGFKEATEALSQFLNLDIADNITALEERQILLNRELIIRRDILKEEIAAASLRGEATKDTKIRAQAYEEAISKINELSSKEKELAQLELDILVEKAKLSNNTREDNDAIAEATARLNQIERERLSQLKEITTKQLANNEQIQAARDKEAQAIAEEIRLKEQLAQVNERLSVQSDKEINIDIPAKVTGTLRYLDAINKTIAQNEKASAQRAKDAQLDVLVKQQKIANASLVLSQTKTLFKEESAAYKALAISQASIDTYRGATAALAPPPTGAGPLFGPILAAITIALGLANVAKIAGFSAAAGGGKFMTRGPAMLMVGDNPGGVERVTVEPISGRGKTTVNGNLIKMAGGGVLETQSVTNPINQAFAFRSQSQSPMIVASWKEATELRDRISFKEALVTA